MKQKHNKMNIWLVFFVVALFVVSSGMSAMGSLVTNEVEKENNEENAITMNSGVTLDCGSIRVNGKPGSYPNVDYSCSAKDYSGVDVGSGCSVTVKVSYHLWTGGDDDKATARIWFTDKPSDKATFTTPDNNNVQEGTLQLTKYMDDSSSYSLKLEVEWRDYITTANILVGGIIPSDTSNIQTREYNPVPIMEVNPNSLSDRGEGCFEHFFVKNVGDSGSSLAWSLTVIQKNGNVGLPELDISPTSGTVTGGSYTRVDVKYVFPSKMMDESFSWRIRVTSSNTGQSEDVTVSFNSGIRARNNLGANLQLFTLLQARFPQLFTLLQRLPAFQQ